MTTLDPTTLPALFPDVTPTPQTDLSAVCSISYTDDFKLAYDYLRSVLRTDERTDRTLRLTGLCLKLNPANYTVWHYRRRILSSLHATSSSSSSSSNDGNGGEEDDVKRSAVILPPSVLQAELSLAASLGGANPKNYQIWYHRRALLEPLLLAGGVTRTGDEKWIDGADEAKANLAADAAREELDYVASVLDDDGKNYHAWSHRQWIVRTLTNTSRSHPLWSSERTYAQNLISADHRNNSAWNHLWFASHHGLHVPLTLVDAEAECTYALGVAELDPHNESPWRYMVGVVREQVRRGGQKRTEAAGTEAEGHSKLVHRMAEQAERIRCTIDGPCPNADAARVDLLELHGKEDGDGTEHAVAAGLADKLGAEDDTIRRKYWTMRSEALRPSGADIAAAK